MARHRDQLETIDMVRVVVTVISLMAKVVVAVIPCMEVTVVVISCWRRLVWLHATAVVGDTSRTGWS